MLVHTKLKNLPDPNRLVAGAIYEATLTLEEEERMLADEIALLPGVASVELANTDTATIKIQVVTGANLNAEDLERISDKCAGHGIHTTLDDIQPVRCAVFNEYGRLLATF